MENLYPEMLTYKYAAITAISGVLFWAGIQYSNKLFSDYRHQPEIPTTENMKAKWAGPLLAAIGSVVTSIALNVNPLMDIIDSSTNAINQLLTK